MLHLARPSRSAGRFGLDLVAKHCRNLTHIALVLDWSKNELENQAAQQWKCQVVRNNSRSLVSVHGLHSINAETLQALTMCAQLEHLELTSDVIEPESECERAFPLVTRRNLPNLQSLKIAIAASDLPSQIAPHIPAMPQVHVRC